MFKKFKILHSKFFHFFKFSKILYLVMSNFFCFVAGSGFGNVQFKIRQTVLYVFAVSLLFPAFSSCCLTLALCTLSLQTLIRKIDGIVSSEIISKNGPSVIKDYFNSGTKVVF